MKLYKILFYCEIGKITFELIECDIVRETANCYFYDNKIGDTIKINKNKLDKIANSFEENINLNFFGYKIYTTDKNLIDVYKKELIANIEQRLEVTEVLLMDYKESLKKFKS